MSERTTAYLARVIGARFALDLYMRHLMNFGVVALGVDQARYTDIINDRLANSGGYMTLGDMQYVIQIFKRIAEVPEDPWIQVAIDLVKY